MAITSGSSGVLVTHENHFADGTDPPYYAWTPLMASGLNKDSWSTEPLGITHLVGLPMRCMPFSMTSGQGSSETVALLSIDCDSKSATFGNALHRCEIDALFARAGIEDLQGLHVKALVAFVETVLADLVAFDKLVDDDEIEAMRPKAEIAAAKATRAEFEIFYEKYHADSAAAGERLKFVESPYAATPFRKYMPRCVCGDHRGDGGAALLFCGRCKKVRYCSKVCQAKDRKGHKVFCRED